MTDSPNDLPFIMLPGVGTDARMFAMQRAAFPQLTVPDWLPPGRRESLADYAARFAATLDPGRPCIIGGMSFGGMVALEMTRHLPAVACVLISSVKSARELPRWMRVCGPAAWLLPPRTDRWVAGFGTCLRYTIGPFLSPHGQQFCKHLSKTRSEALPWVCHAVVKWRPTDAAWPCPVFHLHGDADILFPHRWTHPDRLVPGGGHALPMTHPYAVNEFLRECLQRVSVPLEAQG